MSTAENFWPCRFTAYGRDLVEFGQRVAEALWLENDASRGLEIVVHRAREACLDAIQAFGEEWPT